MADRQGRDPAGRGPQARRPPRPPARRRGPGPDGARARRPGPPPRPRTARPAAARRPPPPGPAAATRCSWRSTPTTTASSPPRRSPRPPVDPQARPEQGRDHHRGRGPAPAPARARPGGPRRPTPGVRRLGPPVRQGRRRQGHRRGAAPSGWPGCSKRATPTATAALEQVRDRGPRPPTAPRPARRPAPPPPGTPAPATGGRVASEGGDPVPRGGHGSTGR